MFGDVGALVNEHCVGSDIVKGFNSVIVAQIAVGRGLSMSHLASYGGGVFALEHDFANSLGFVRDGRADILQAAGMRQDAIMFFLVALAEPGDVALVAMQNQSGIAHG